RRVRDHRRLAEQLAEVEKRLPRDGTAASHEPCLERAERTDHERGTESDDQGLQHREKQRVRHATSSNRRSAANTRSEEHTSELQSPYDLVCRLLLEKKNIKSQ